MDSTYVHTLHILPCIPYHILPYLTLLYFTLLYLLYVVRMDVADSSHLAMCILLFPAIW
jgi:hypothetical protein